MHTCTPVSAFLVGEMKQAYKQEGKRPGEVLMWSPLCILGGGMVDSTGLEFSVLPLSSFVALNTYRLGASVA